MFKKIIKCSLLTLVISLILSCNIFAAAGNVYTSSQVYSTSSTFASGNVYSQYNSTFETNSFCLGNIYSNEIAVSIIAIEQNDPVVQNNNGPSILSVKINDKQIVTNDYVDNQPVVNVIATDNLALSSYRVEVYDSNDTPINNDTSLVSITENLAMATLNIQVPDQIVAGSYYIKVTIVNTSGISTASNTAIFNVAAADDLLFTNVLSAPNPFNPDDGVAHIGYQLNKTAEVELYIYSVNGDLVHSEKQTSTSGYSEFVWDGDAEWGDVVENGGYLAYVIADAGGKKVKKLIKIAVLR